MSTDHTFDVAVIGAGVFGAWTAYQLRLAGADVLLVDAYGAGNSRASSGGESRIIRMGYGPDAIYTRMAQRSFLLWTKFLADIGQPQLFQPTGVLWLAQEHDSYCDANLENFKQNNVKFERLDRGELARRYPQVEPGPVAWGILEPDSGVLLARQAVQAVVAAARAAGVGYVQEAVRAPRKREAVKRGIEEDGQRGTGQGGDGGTGRDVLDNIKRDGRVEAIETISGRKIVADKFVFACGPWLPKLFPELLADLIHVTRQEVFFLGVPAGDDRFAPPKMPTWIDFNDLVYCIPNVDNRGLKIAIDEHGPQFDPDTGERIVFPESVNAVRAYLARRLPALADAPVTETRVCQYENTSNGDFLIDRHPAFANAWLVGGGSGHGFKHGPVVGEHVAALLSGDAEVEPRFSLATKDKVQQRKVY
jgi:glycine/D-amino acid oxidase-like deaminating enzyme